MTPSPYIDAKHCQRAAAAVAVS